MTTTRRLTIAAGLLYFVTHVTSVPAALVLYRPMLDDPAFVLGTGPSTGVLLGALLEVVLAVAVVGTGVALYPIVRRFHEASALGYAVLRTLEAAVILAGVLAVLAVVSVRVGAVAAAGGDVEASTWVALSDALLGVHRWSFLIGPNFVLCANTALLAFALHRSRLVPRFIPTLGLIGSATLLVAATAVLFGRIEQVSLWGALAAAPVMLWELSLAVRLVWRGVDPVEPADRRPSPAREGARSAGALTAPGA